MASFGFTNFKRGLLAGEFDLAVGGDDIRVLLVMTNTDANTTEDALTFGGITTLDEFDGAGYSTPGLALANEAVANDDPNNRGEFDADNVTFSGLSAGSRDIQAAIVYMFVTNLGLSVPFAYIDTGGFPKPANGGDIVIAWNAEGIIQTT